MKTYKILSIAVICLSLTFSSFAQKVKSETLKVSGNCGMCKTKIEKAAKNAGATFAEWDVEEKVLSVKYNSKSTNNAKIEEAIAATGYDTDNFKATDEAYSKLHGCCKYDRGSAKKDGDKKMGCSTEGADGKACCKKDADKKMDCCKNGKCEKHDKH